MVPRSRVDLAIDGHGQLTEDLSREDYEGMFSLCVLLSCS